MLIRGRATAVCCAARVVSTRPRLAGSFRQVAAAEAEAVAALTTRRTWSSRPVAVGVRRLRERTSGLAGVRSYASKSADEVMEEIEEQYNTAVDEFEIATEETEKMSVYAEEDRKAARQELDKLQAMYDNSIADASVREEIRKRAGQRIKELSQAVANLEQLATEQD